MSRQTHQSRWPNPSCCPRSSHEICHFTRHEMTRRVNYRAQPVSDLHFTRTLGLGEVRRSRDMDVQHERRPTIRAGWI